MADPVFQFIGQMLVAGGGGAVVAWLLVQWLGKKWIENKFAERLEQLKHDQNVEVARLKVEIDLNRPGIRGGCLNRPGIRGGCLV